MSEVITVKHLSEANAEQVRKMDDKSSNYLEQWLEDDGYAYGVFKGDTLVGYCSIGYADDVSSEIENYEGRTPDSLLLSNVYVDKEHRGNGYGTLLVKEAIQLRQEYDGLKELVFCQPITEALIAFYKGMGFVEFEPMEMVLPVKKEPNIFQYKGYQTTVRYCEETGLYNGVIEGIKDFVNFQTQDQFKIEKEFQSAVEDYIAYCLEVEKEPER